MKKLLILLVVFTISITTKAQDKIQTQTEKGKYFLELNTPVGGIVGSSLTTPSTGINYSSFIGYNKHDVKGSTWNLGVNGGYFVDKNLALKVGLGIGQLRSDEIEYNVNGIYYQEREDYAVTLLSYQLGIKYYILNKIPLEISYLATSSILEDEEKKYYNSDNPILSYLKFQGGYAFFLGDYFSIEPGIIYNVALKDENKNLFQINVGFSLFL